MNDIKEFLRDSFQLFADLPEETNARIDALSRQRDSLNECMLVLWQRTNRIKREIAKVLLLGIQNRHSMSSKRGIDEAALKNAINEILSNMDMCLKICDVESAFGSEFTIFEVTAEEIVLVDTRHEPNKEAQVDFLRSLHRAGREYELVVKYLEEKFHSFGLNVRKALEFAEQPGVHYYDAELICACTGADLMTKDEYEGLVEIAEVDQSTSSWMKRTNQSLMWDGAMSGIAPSGKVRFCNQTATDRCVAAARPILRLQRKKTTPTA